MPATHKTGHIDPLYRLGDFFLLSDFLGCSSVYRVGYANPLADDDMADRKLDNAEALCAHALDPLVRKHGALSVTYGYICPDLSRAIVKYQDPDKPSHHRWDLGAAADVVVHSWVEEESPIALAHAMHAYQIPFSRLITYSESPGICVAVSAREVAEGKPRLAMYENRYMGKPRVKPKYTQMPTEAAKRKHYEDLCANGLPFGWEGAGYPTHHGGGYRQMHHIRISEKTVLTDWLIDLQLISQGERNIPRMRDGTVLDNLAAAGMVYDALTGEENPRMSILSGYVSPTASTFNPENNWNTTGPFSFIAMPHVDVGCVLSILESTFDPDVVSVEHFDSGALEITIHEAERVLAPGCM